MESDILVQGFNEAEFTRAWGPIHEVDWWWRQQHDGQPDPAWAHLEPSHQEKGRETEPEGSQAADQAMDYRSSALPLESLCAIRNVCGP